MSKYKVGDKFIIEIEKVYESSLKGIDVFEDMTEPLYKIKGFNSLVFDKNGLDRLEEVSDKKNNIATESICVGDICKFGTNEEVDIYVTMGKGSPMSDLYVEGFYLSGKNKGHIGKFKLKELRKTGKRVELDKILNWEK